MTVVVSYELTSCIYNTKMTKQPLVAANVYDIINIIHMI